MVRALLDGRKTQTRRLAWKEPTEDFIDHVAQVGGGVPHMISGKASPWQRVKPGDLLWVRETAVITPENWTDHQIDATHPGRRIVQYLASEPDVEMARQYKLKTSPSIHMPRWASRLTLEVTATKIERLQAISEEDAKAEGVAMEALSGDLDPLLLLGETESF